MRPKDPAFFSPFPDGRHMFVSRDDQQTVAEITRVSPIDARRYPDYESFLERVARFVEPWLLRTPPDLVRRRWGDVLALARLGLSAMRLRPSDLAQALRMMTQSATDFLDGWFESEELKSSLAPDRVTSARGGACPRGPAWR